MISTTLFINDFASNQVGVFLKKTYKSLLFNQRLKRKICYWIVQFLFRQTPDGNNEVTMTNSGNINPGRFHCVQKITKGDFLCPLMFTLI